MGPDYATSPFQRRVDHFSISFRPIQVFNRLMTFEASGRRGIASAVCKLGVALFYHHLVLNV